VLVVWLWMGLFADQNFGGGVLLCMGFAVCDVDLD
jgi:hypothetical protein